MSVVVFPCVVLGDYMSGLRRPEEDITPRDNVDPAEELEFFQSAEPVDWLRSLIAEQKQRLGEVSHVPVVELKLNCCAEA